MAVSYPLGAGTLTLGVASIGVQSVTYEETAEVIELYSNKSFPVAVGLGKKKASGTFQIAGYDDAIVTSIENAVIAPVASATTLTWALPAVGGVTKTFTLANVVITSKKATSGNDKFMTMECSYVAFAELSGDTVLTVS